jgi:hypothetical protein
LSGGYAALLKKMKGLFFSLISSLFVFFSAALTIFSSFTVAAIDTYRDKNGYFTMVPPQGWKIEESSTEDRSKVLFRSPDGKAAIGIIAVLDNDNIGNLLLTKAEYVEDHKQRFPSGRFALSQETLCDFSVIKVEYEMPTILKEEFYYFFSDGVRFDVTYGVPDASDFETYKSVARDALCSLKPQRRTAEQ